MFKGVSLFHIRCMSWREVFWKSFSFNSTEIEFILDFRLFDLTILNSHFTKWKKVFIRSFLGVFWALVVSGTCKESRCLFSSFPPHKIITLIVRPMICMLAATDACSLLTLANDHQWTAQSVEYLTLFAESWSRTNICHIVCYTPTPQTEKWWLCATL